VDSKECRLWKKAMVEEMNALDKNEAWDLVEWVTGRKLVCSQWVFSFFLEERGVVSQMD
jgi:hypothetical protein